MIYHGDASRTLRAAEELVFAGHLVLAVLHGLGVLYHARRRAWLHAGLHAVGAGFDAWAAVRHARNLRDAR